MNICKSNLLKSVLRLILLANVFYIISSDSVDEETPGPSSPLEKTEESAGTSPTPSLLQLDDNSKNLKLLSLAESIKRSKKNESPQSSKSTEDQWKRALKEIKNLAVPRSFSDDPDARMDEINLFRRWRALLNEPTKVELDPKTKTTTATIEQDINGTSSTFPESTKSTPRFDGFASWERMLQDWSDDVQEYMEKIESENNGYPMSQFGNSEKVSSQMPTEEKEKKLNDDESTVHANEFKDDSAIESKHVDDSEKKSISLPVPAARKDGEAVLPHTDIADKSKNILIVTTAALPWMTGTAVNPLLRSAYMTMGRSEAGGSVTLMLPWLERRQDQEEVYGPDKTFDSPEEQELYIRNWLRDSAKMSVPSEELKIKWYAAWQNKAENSVYSMGDITALIPKEDVDICILEEPEHLNWYRAPGDSWTDKFKHVVGIIHTNYFVYAQEQPAAFIRVSLYSSWVMSRIVFPVD